MLDIFLLNPGGGPVTQMTGEADVGKMRKGIPCWFDLYDPTRKEEEAVEKFLGLNLPTRGEMVEIEASSRIYTEGEALYLTTSLVAGAGRPVAQTDAMTCVLTDQYLVTIRYHDPTPLRTFKALLMRADSKAYANGPRVMTGLLDTIIDRLADILEIIGNDLDDLSREIFLPTLLGGAAVPEEKSAPAAEKPLAPVARTVASGGPKNMRQRVRPNDRDLDLRLTLAQLGRSGDLISKARESLVSINRVLTFFTEQCREGGRCSQPTEVQLHLGNLSQDLASLLDHASFLNGKVAFLLDATLGLINVEQNQIIKIFSIAAVIFLPPTLIASVFGMNVQLSFDDIAFGWALALMVISAIIPVVYFKVKGWM